MVRPNIFKDELDLINQLEKIEPVDPETRKNYVKFRSDITKQAISSLRERIPIKILYFNKLVNINAAPGTLLNASDMEKKDFYESDLQCSSDTSTNMVTSSEISSPVNNESFMVANRGKKAKLNDGSDCYTHIIPPHKQIGIELEKVKCEAYELIEMIGNIKLWIQLNIPRIEDGNNFGVSIQEEAIQELARVEDSAFNLFESILKYYMARAKISSKIIKYPNVSDYKEAVRELDEKEWLHIKITLVDMRNNYSLLYDLLNKNWEKVLKPKNEDSGHRMVF